MSIRTDLYFQAMDRNHGDQKRSDWEVQIELEDLARQGNEEAIAELSSS